MPDGEENSLDTSDPSQETIDNTDNSIDAINDLISNTDAARDQELQEKDKEASAKTIESSIADAKGNIPDSVTVESVNEVLTELTNLNKGRDANQEAEADEVLSTDASVIVDGAEANSNSSDSAADTYEVLSNTTHNVATAAEVNMQNDANESGRGDEYKKASDKETEDAEDYKKKAKDSRDNPSDSDKKKAAIAARKAYEKSRDAANKIRNEILEGGGEDGGPSNYALEILKKGGEAGKSFFKGLLSHWKLLLFLGVGAGVGLVISRICASLTGCYRFNGTARMKLDKCLTTDSGKGIATITQSGCDCSPGSDYKAQCGSGTEGKKPKGSDFPFAYCPGGCGPNKTYFCKGNPGEDKAIYYAWQQADLWNFWPLLVTLIRRVEISVQC